MIETQPEIGIGNQLIPFTKAARLVGVHPATLRRRAKVGLLATVQIGGTGRHYLRLDDMRALLGESTIIV